MYALLANGPMANRQIAVDDPPPSIVNMEAPRPDVFDQPAIPPGAEFRDARFVTHPYRFIGVDQISSLLAPGSSREFAIYSYAPDLARAT